MRKDDAATRRAALLRLSVRCVTAERRIRSIISQMESLGLNGDGWELRKAADLLDGRGKDYARIAEGKPRFEAL